MPAYHRYSAEVAFALDADSETDALRKVSEVVLPLLTTGALCAEVRLITPTRQDRRLQGYSSERNDSNHFVAVLVFDSPEESWDKAAAWISLALAPITDEAITVTEIYQRTFGGG